MRSIVVIAFILKTIFLIFHDPTAISIVVEVVESVVQSSSSVKGALSNYKYSLYLDLSLDLSFNFEFVRFSLITMQRCG